MKRQIIISVFTLFLFAICHFVSAQDEITIVTPISEVAEGLDLYAVAEIFKDSENLEEFEKAINDPDIGINNLDLDGDGYVDYIRVVEQISDYTHVIILQVPLGENEYQDIATIEIEKTGDEDYNMQVHGNEVIYGVDYYVSPVYVHIYRWPIIPWIFRPIYRPYRSVFYFGYYPHWWIPYRPVAVHVYRTRTVRYRRRASFEMIRENRVHTVHKVNYKPHTSILVKKKIEVDHPPTVREAVPLITKPTRPRGETTPVRNDMETKNKKTVERPAQLGVKKPAKPRLEKNTNDKNEIKNSNKSTANRSTTFNSEKKKTTKPMVEKRTIVNSEAKKTAEPKVKKSPTIKSGAKKTTKPKEDKKTTVKKDNKKTAVKNKNN